MSDVDWTTPAEPSTESATVDGIGPVLAFESLPVFVRDFFLEVAVRHEQPKQWCRQWWDHEEAVIRLEALWDAFETLRVEPGTGTAVWIRDYLDPTVAALTNPDTTPFKRCDARKGQHVAHDAWPVDEPPEAMFRTYATHGYSGSSE